jgi:NADP-dependent 3-hydroxy acid dehydrogenase YdfG
MAGPLDGKVAAITGASSGIGEATALALAEAGAAVALGARREDRLRDLAERIDSDGGRARPYGVDVGDEASARAFIESAHSDLGRVDILVNNAGLMLLGPIEGADTEDWRRMVNVNLLGLLYCTHAALPLMREQGGGDIVNVSSVAGRFAGPGSGVYNLTKFGVNAFSAALREVAVAAKIRVIVVEPGYVETELQGHNENPMVQEAMAKSKEKIGEVLRAEDIADGIAYAVTRPSHVAINEVLIRPAGQAR